LTRVRIRGIYSTALTKLLLDQGFDIVQPSVAIKERFKLKKFDEPPDLDVYDRPDRQGVHALGKDEALNAFVSTLKFFLVDVIVRRWKVAPEGIYKGLVKGVDPTAQSVLVDIGPATGRVANKEIRSPKQGCFIVQVEGITAGTKEPILTTEIKIPGKYAILVPGRGVKISRKVQDWQTRSRLSKLGEELAPPGWGILWRTAASGQSPETLRDEVINLTRKGQSILERAEEVGAPTVLWEESRFADVEFPALSKEGLDEARGSIAPTLRRHHYYKACGGRVSSALEMAEALLERGRPRGEVESLFKQTVEGEYPIEGFMIGIEHAKLDGQLFNLGPAQIEALDDASSMIRFRRNFEREGTYDGLGTHKEPGDYAVTEARMGEWFFKTSYFSKDGQYKGTYVNLNTPMEFYPRGIRYVDLEVDICLWPDGRVKKLDEEKLDTAAAEGLVTEKLTKVVKEKMEGLMKDVSRLRE